VSSGTEPIFSIIVPSEKDLERYQRLVAWSRERYAVLHRLYAREGRPSPHTHIEAAARRKYLE
jgi:hypothetical protein